MFTKTFAIALTCLVGFGGSLAANQAGGRKSNSQTASVRPAVEEGYVGTDDGTRLFYQKVGVGRQVVIIPGGLFMFRDFSRLANGRTLIFYDMRGRGRSDAIPDSKKGGMLSIHDDVKDVERIRRHFKVDKCSLIGYSYLGLMTVMYAMDHPDAVFRIVQLGPVPLKFGASYPEQYVNNDELTDIGVTAEELARVRKLATDGYHETNPEDYCEQEWRVTRFRLVGNPANVEKLGRSNCDLPNEWPVNLAKHFDSSFASVQELDIAAEQVARVKVPVLTIHGTKDRNAPYGSGREWVSILSDARLLTIPNAAHNSWVEAPEVIFPAIDGFLKGRWPNGAVKGSALSSRKASH